ncbi:MAG: SAM-dependent methyltransferase [Bacteroidaceae bacterium]|nr:SAM-dependent methyltransferase [Bacteroidaceae bacterium]
MELDSPQREIYSKDRLSALQAQRLAQEIAFAPVVFQVSRLMIKFGIFKMLDDAKDGLTQAQIVEKSGISNYGVQCLLESSLTIGTIIFKDNRYYLAKAGWFLINDDMVQANLNFNHDVNYLGLFNLEEAILNGKPEGLKVFGSWPTIYEALSQLPPQVQKSWFGFDHFYSDNSFDQALQIVFDENNARSLLDVGGNTGRFATRCVAYKDNINVTIMDLKGQLDMMRKATSGLKGADRISGHACNLLDPSEPFPTGFDAIWMSQFLDCFSEEQVVSILTRAAASMQTGSKLYIMETLWDKQKFETASYCLAQTSIYFTAMANGNSKMFYSGDLERLVEESGLTVEKLYSNLGLGGHSIMQCVKKI